MLNVVTFMKKACHNFLDTIKLLTVAPNNLTFRKNYEPFKLIHK